MTFEEYLESLTQASSREEHFAAKIAGEEPLENEYIPSSREEGFAYKIARRLYDSMPFIVNIVARPAGTGLVTVLDKTAGEIIEALKTRPVVVHWDSADNDLTTGLASATTSIDAQYAYSDAGIGSCHFHVYIPGVSPMEFYAASSSDTPVLD